MRPKIVFISHVYTIVYNQRKLEYFADWADIVVMTSRLEDSKSFAKGNEIIPDCETLKVERLKMFGSQRAVTLGFKGLCKRLRNVEKIDLFVVEAEPWSLLRWQSRLLAFIHHPKARFVEFTWENIPRVGYRGQLLALIYRLAAITSNTVIAGNLGAKRILLKNGFSEAQISLSPQFGIEPSDFPRRESGEREALRRDLGLQIKRNDIVIGFCGRIIEGKGVKEIFAATEALINKGFDRLKLVMMGPGNLKEVLGVDSLPEWCFQLPPGTHRDVPKFMGCLDYLVLGSKTEFRKGTLQPLWEEQFGRVLIEGMASGVAVLGARSGAIPEVLREEAIFESGDAASLCESLENLLKNESERQLILSNQYEDLHSLFTMEKVAQRWSEILKASL